MSQPDVHIFAPETLTNPWHAYKRLRDEAPVYRDPLFGLFLITRYDLLREAIRDTDTFSSRFDQFLGTAQQMAFDAAPESVKATLVELNRQMVPVPPTMITLDEPEHTRYRSLVNRLFTASRINEGEAAVRKVIDDTIAAFGSATELDFVARFAAPVPLTIIADRLGIPEEDRPFFEDAATAAAAALRITPVTPQALVHRAQLALDLQKLLIRLVEARRAEPANDMITILATSRLEDEDRPLTHGECISILNQFLVAGHETTTSAFAFGMHLLCLNPDLQDAIRGDAGRVRTFVEEALRMESPVQGLPRVVTRDMVFGGVELAKGSLVMLRFGAANRDERQFDRPDEVDVERPKAGMQMAFGSGVHHCIGAPLARQELNLGFAALLEHGRDFRMQPDRPPPTPEASFILRNLPELHIAFDRR